MVEPIETSIRFISILHTLFSNKEIASPVRAKLSSPRRSCLTLLEWQILCHSERTGSGVKNLYWCSKVMHSVYTSKGSVTVVRWNGDGTSTGLSDRHFKLILFGGWACQNISQIPLTTHYSLFYILYSLIKRFLVVRASLCRNDKSYVILNDVIAEWRISIDVAMSCLMTALRRGSVTVISN